MARDDITNAIEPNVVPDTLDTTPMPGFTAAMEIAGVESIPGADPDKIILGFARED